MIEQFIIDIPFKTKTGAREDSITEIPPNRAERVLLEHRPDGVKLFARFFGISCADKGSTFPNG
jgi:hypothetical protein